MIRFKNFLTEATDASTYFEGVISVCLSMSGYSQKRFKDNILKDNILLKFIVSVEAILILFLVYIVIERTDSQKTVFMPPQSTYKEFWISGNQVSKSYLENIGSFIAYNLLNVTKGNANELLSNLLPLVQSSTYYDVKKELQQLQNYIVQNQISRSFYLGYIEQTKSNQIIVYGSISDAISSKIIRTKKIKLIIDYNIKFGRFYIVNLSIKDD